MEVKVYKQIEYLPKVFLTPDLVKFSIINRYLNCTRYSSRSGATQEGCLEIGNNVREVRGIYYVPIKPYTSIVFRRKEISDENDVIKILKDFPRPLGINLLVSWNNYEIYLYDEFVKGRKIEFPIAGKQGHLTISYIPPIKQVYKKEIIDDKEVMELDKGKFEEVKELQIYNHTIKFDVNILRFSELYRFGGDGEIIYVPESTMVKIVSPDHQLTEFSVSRNLWLLFSHPRPKRNSQD